MARTDVHRPWPVQVADPHNRHLIRQYATHRGEPLYTSHRNLCCGCQLCTGQPGRKRARRRERVHWRSERQGALADLGREPRPIRGRAW
jgi:hypothetical protein